jgi:hypothetical protein
VRWCAGLRRRAAKAEPDSGASPSRERTRETSVTGVPRLSAEREKERGSARGDLGQGLVGRAQKGKEERRRREEGHLGRAARERGKAGSGQAAREKWKRKRKRRVGRAQLGSKRKEEMHLNAFGFEFKT